MSRLISLGINYPALADGVCPTLHPFLESYEVELVSETKGAETVIVCIDGEGW